MTNLHPIFDRIFAEHFPEPKPMRTIDMMTDRELQDLRDAGRGHLIDGAGPMLDKADRARKLEREEGPQQTEMERKTDE